MTTKTFNPADHLTDLRGKQYLEVKWRIAWFRSENPTGTILTEILNSAPLTIKATILVGSTVLATGHGTAASKANAVWSGREVEKAETAAIGRALAHAGYGSQFTDEDESDNLADSPIEKPLTIDEARQVIVKTTQGEKFLGEMTPEQLNAVIAKVPSASAAARLVLATDHSITEEGKE